MLHGFQGHRKGRLRPRPRMSVIFWREHRPSVSGIAVLYRSR